MIQIQKFTVKPKNWKMHQDLLHKFEILDGFVLELGWEFCLGFWEEIFEALDLILMGFLEGFELILLVLGFDDALVSLLAGSL